MTGLCLGHKEHRSLPTALLLSPPSLSLMPAACCCWHVPLAKVVLLHVWLAGASLVCGHCERLLHPLCLQPPALSLDTILPSSWECPSCGEPNQVRLLLLPLSLLSQVQNKVAQETSQCTYKNTLGNKQ